MNTYRNKIKEDFMYSFEALCGYSKFLTEMYGYDKSYVKNKNDVEVDTFYMKDKNIELKLMDTILFNTESKTMFTPQKWIFTDLMGNLHYKDLKNLNLSNIIKVFFINSSLGKNAFEYSNEDLMEFIQKNSLDSIALVMNKNKRYFLNVSDFSTIKNKFPEGIDALQLFRIPTRKHLGSFFCVQYSKRNCNFFTMDKVKLHRLLTIKKSKKMPIEERTKNIVIFNYFKRAFKSQKYFQLTEQEQDHIQSKKKDLNAKVTKVVRAIETTKDNIVQSLTCIFLLEENMSTFWYVTTEDINVWDKKPTRMKSAIPKVHKTKSNFQSKAAANETTYETNVPQFENYELNRKNLQTQGNEISDAYNLLGNCEKDSHNDSKSETRESMQAKINEKNYQCFMVKPKGQQKDSKKSSIEDLLGITRMDKNKSGSELYLSRRSELEVYRSYSNEKPSRAQGYIKRCYSSKSQKRKQSIHRRKKAHSRLSIRRNRVLQNLNKRDAWKEKNKSVSQVYPESFPTGVRREKHIGTSDKGMNTISISQNPYRPTTSKKKSSRKSSKKTSIRSSIADPKINLQLKNGEIFEKEYTINDLNDNDEIDLVHERSTIDIAEEPNILEKIEAHNEYLMDLEKDTSEYVIIDRRKKSNMKIKGSLFNINIRENNHSASFIKHDRDNSGGLTINDSKFRERMNMSGGMRRARRDSKDSVYSSHIPSSLKGALSTYSKRPQTSHYNTNEI
ncbi:unnamed protein product [Moneuplotes crassus]|uniref:Uncharacterized protein n=1 Tax=Euplotes crassus TaxID=5936 RepID=A0AAD2D8C1_EUPCR|nr:unnamed protein product [Moneuplotes crassus]